MQSQIRETSALSHADPLIDANRQVKSRLPVDNQAVAKKENKLSISLGKLTAKRTFALPNGAETLTGHQAEEYHRAYE